QTCALPIFGVFGISFGGMAAVMLAALDDRIDAVVAAMAGGDLPHLMVNTSYRAVARQINQALRESGTSRERLAERLAEMIDSDPLRFAPYVDAGEILLVVTRTDMIVPFESQEKLRRALGEPETLYLPTGHRTSVFYFPFLRNSARAFFERQFSARNGRRPRALAGPADRGRRAERVLTSRDCVLLEDDDVAAVDGESAGGRSPTARAPATMSIPCS